MKPFINFLATSLLVLLISSSGYSQTEHIGLWKGVDKGEVGYVNMDSNGYAYFLVNGDKLGGKSFTMNGLQAEMKYEISYTEPVNTIDFIVTSKADKQVIGILPGIFKFDKKNNLILCVNFEGQDRPTEFIEYDTILLEKVNSASGKKKKH